MPRAAASVHTIITPSLRHQHILLLPCLFPVFDMEACHSPPIRNKPLPGKAALYMGNRKVHPLRHVCCMHFTHDSQSTVMTHSCDHESERLPSLTCCAWWLGQNPCPEATPPCGTAAAAAQLLQVWRPPHSRLPHWLQTPASYLCLAPGRHPPSQPPAPSAHIIGHSGDR
jgi:hypothetical protein